MRYPRIQIDACAYLFAAVCVLLLPFSWLMSWLFAVTFHEIGHLMALRLCHIRIDGIRIGFLGAEISTASLTPLQELLCAGAGPLCSFSLLLAVSDYPAAAMIGLVQGIFNLLPIYPLDGGRMLRSIVILIRENMDARKTPCKE